MGGCFQDKNKDTSFPDREGQYTVPYPRTWYGLVLVSLTKAPVTYNSTLDVTVVCVGGGGGGFKSRYFLSLSNPFCFWRLRRRIHSHSPTTLGQGMFQKRLVLFVPPGDSPFFAFLLAQHTRASSIAQPFFFFFFLCSGFSAASGAEGGGGGGGGAKATKGCLAWRRVFPDQERGN
jgi:hypothetical protein